MTQAERDTERPEAYLHLDGVSKTYAAGQTPAVDKVTLAIPAGEMVSLLGPSGCGKTTTLRMIAGLESPTEGRIRVAGKDITGDPPHRRAMGMFFQSYALFPHMTVGQNIAFGLRMRHVPKSESRAKVKEMLDLVELPDLADRRIGQLSGGQRQRIALARALVIEPQVLLLDEPLSNLDAKLRVTMRGEIRRIQKKLGITAVFVTHDQEEALTISDKVAVMSNGHLEQFGSPEEIYNSPASRFVAGFVGDVNLLKARVVSASSPHDAVAYAQILGTNQQVPIAVERSAVDQVSQLGQSIELICRPHELRLRGAVGSPAARVSNVVFAGDRIHYSVTIENSSVGLSVDVPSASDGTGVLRTGDGVDLVWPESGLAAIPA